MSETNPTESGGAPQEAGTAVQEAASAAEFAEIQDAQGLPGQEAALSTLYDLTMPISIELGRTKMTVQDLLTLSRGSVIQLDRLAGEPMDVYVGDRRFAEGEVVVIGEQFGIRITRVLTTQERSGDAG